MMRKRFVSLGVAFLMLASAALPASAQSPSTLVELNDVTVTTQPDTVTVTVKTSGPARYQAQLLESPSRLIMDFEGTVYRWRSTPLKVAAEPLIQVRGAQFKRGTSRLVVELTRKVGYILREDADGLTLVIPTAAIALDADKPKVSAGAPTKPLTEPPFRIAQAQMLPQLAQAPAAPSPAPPAPAEGQKLISLDFKDADVVNLLRILAAESTRNIVIGDDVKGKMSITLRNVPWQLALDTVLEAKGLVKVEKDGVLRIVTSEQLAKEREAARRLEEAKLKAETEIRQKIAEAQLKEAEAAQRKAAAEAAAAEAVRRGPLVEETIRLSYADPDEIVKTLQGILGIAPGVGGGAPAGAPGGPGVIPAPPFSQLFGPGQPPPSAPPTPSAEVLAKGITIQAYKPTNSIFIRMYANDLERIKTLIREKLDIPLPQVKIQARLEELNRESFFEIGVQWGGAMAKRDGSNVLVSQGFTGADSPTRAGIGPAPGKIDGTPPGAPINPNIASPPNLLSLLPISAATGLPTGGNLVNLPITNASVGALGGFAFGIIGTNYNLNLVLQALEQQGKTRSVSRPEIATVENSKALIKLGQEIPYATVSSAGTQIQFKEAVLNLEVTPTVVIEPNSTRVKMVVIVEDNSQASNLTTVGTSVPIINKRRAETQVLVKEGETLAIGGIMQRKEIETIRKIPILGDIPILGWLFKVKRVDLSPNRELVVFITPSLVTREGATATRR